MVTNIKSLPLIRKAIVLFIVVVRVLFLVFAIKLFKTTQKIFISGEPDETDCVDSIFLLNNPISSSFNKMNFAKSMPKKSMVCIPFTHIKNNNYII